MADPTATHVGNIAAGEDSHAAETTLENSVSSLNSTNSSASTSATSQGAKQDEPDVSIALNATDMDAVPGLIKDINSLSADLDTNDPVLRLKLMAKAKSLWQSLETPRETMLRHVWAEPSLHCALTAGTVKDVWAYVAKIDGPFTGAEIANETNIEHALLARLLRHVSSMGYLVQLGHDTYQANNFIKSMAFPFINAGYPCISGALLNAHGQFHEWAEKNSWKDPTDINNAPLQYGYNTDKTFFEHLHTNPPYGQLFHLHMGGYRQGRPSWMDDGFFPVRERLINGFEETEDATLLVDIGGSFGHDIEEFHRKFPNAPGRLVLQDLPVVIDQITTLEDKIERMKYDFFTEQPIKGARAYYMHSVLHDWSDETCLEILAQIKAAMKPGYSRLLINENVIPYTGAQWEATALDIMMLTLLASRERTQENWESLLARAGLKVLNIWTVANGVESVIEFFISLLPQEFDVVIKMDEQNYVAEAIPRPPRPPLTTLCAKCQGPFTPSPRKDVTTKFRWYQTLAEVNESAKTGCGLCLQLLRAGTYSYSKDPIKLFEGNGGKICIDTKHDNDGSIERWMDSCIPLDSLTKTFREAIVIARSLGFKYIWIDSLCIIQDDPQDWAYEQMLEPKEKDVPLMKRAWVVQERLLASRTLHFTKNQIFWACQSGTRSISSIVQLIQEKTDDTYVAEQGQRHTPAIASTWSLASNSGDVSWNGHKRQKIIHKYAEVQDVDIKYVTPSNPFGEVLGGTIHLRCEYLSECTVHTRKGRKGIIIDKERKVNGIPRLEHMEFDEFGEHAGKENIRAFWLPLTSVGGFLNGHNGIVLQPTGMKKGEYRRIGKAGLENFPFSYPDHHFPNERFLPEDDYCSRVEETGDGKREFYISII
ncbi:hypothetical protein FSPOR_4095 [Fusarium sporotrichioides]|uniref:O-methyltransferase domain-containing protein n=1 Tax=Fusarium sporotrichioides TaxID=5514 RepID=A0A395SD57_FUSSP|nr:hypothetical protein FSPOR_4095 [Fusarium sporotrichioides]